MTMNNGDIVGSVMLNHMRQLVEARSNEDEWTGVEYHIKNRRIHTGLALRSHRNYTEGQKKSNLEDGSVLTNTLHTRAIYDPQSELELSSQRESLVSPIPGLYIPPYRRHGGDIVPARYLYPISRDHLMPLVEYNVFRATATNFLILGSSRFSEVACPFGASVPTFPNPYQGIIIPPSLEQTPLQQSSQYPVWIDLLPSPKMRDNAIRSQHLFTSNELYADLLGGMIGRQNDVNSGLIAWSNPWEAGGWELTEGFIKKWGFLVRGCVDLFEATHRWRDIRGEERLIFPLD